MCSFGYWLPTRALLPTCTGSSRGAFVCPRPRTPNTHVRLHLLPPQSRPWSHSLHWGCWDYRWVKFTSLHKLFDITNKVKVYQETTRGLYYYRVSTRSPCLETKNINKTPCIFHKLTCLSMWRTWSCGSYTREPKRYPERPAATGEKKKAKHIAHYQPSILSTVKHLQTPSCQTSMVLKLILWVPVCGIKTWKGASDICVTLQ